jgi:dihydroorotase-like cyclic amidohydrolase
VIDPNREQIVTREVLRSAQSRTVFQDGAVRGTPQGQYIKRPVGLNGAAD